MVFKINISEKSGKTYKLEVGGDGLSEKELGNKISGIEVSSDLEGYELQIMGASDKSGFTSMENVEGMGLKRVLLTYGKGMHKKPKGDKKKNSKSPGLRLRKIVRGKVISGDVVQINMKVLKEGSKKLGDIFPEQNQPKEVEEKKG